MCVRLYKEGLSSLLHVGLHFWLRQVLSCKFLAFGNVIKGTIPILVLALFLCSFLGVCCWRRIRYIFGQSQYSDFIILFETKRKHLSPYFSVHLKFCKLFFSYPEVLRSAIKEFRKDDIPCLLCVFPALGNNWGVAPRAFLLISSSLPGTTLYGSVQWCRRDLFQIYYGLTKAQCPKTS